MREELPETYQPRTVPSCHGFPHQAARFRGADPELVRVEVYDLPPLDSLGVSAGDELEAGLFVFDALWQPVLRRTQTVAVDDRPVGFSYGFEMAEGAYHYGLEARAAGPDSVRRAVATAREPLPIRAFPPGRLSISDLLLAERVEPRVDAPAVRGDLTIVPKRTTTLHAGEPVHLYFEIYGLTADGDDFGSYEAELVVVDLAERSIPSRAVRGIQELFRRGPDTEPRLRFTMMTPVRGDAAVEYLTLELETEDAGEYDIRLAVTDAVTGERAESVRRIRILQLKPPLSRSAAPAAAGFQ